MTEQIIELSEEIVNKRGPHRRHVPAHLAHAPLPRAEERRAAPPAREVRRGDERPHAGSAGEPRVAGRSTPSSRSAATTRCRYGVRLHDEGVKVIAIPKTMDNDVPGTDYCIGFCTCVTRTIEMTHALRTSAGSPRALPGDRGVRALRRIHRAAPDDGGRREPLRHPRARVRHRAPLRAARRRPLLATRRSTASCWCPRARDSRAWTRWCSRSEETDVFGHKKLGGIGDMISKALKELSAKFNHGQRINVINQRLGYLVRCGDPDARRLDRADGVRQPRDGPRPRRQSPAASSTCATAATTTSRSRSSPAARRSSTCASSTTPTGCARSTSASRRSRCSS